MAKQKTNKEIKNDVIVRLDFIAKDWIQIPNRTINEKINGVIYSTLALFDGESILPKFIIAPNPQKTDKQKNINEKCNYYPVNYDKRVRGNISDKLHEDWLRYQLRERIKIKKNNVIIVEDTDSIIYKPKKLKKKLSIHTKWIILWVIGYLIGLFCFISSSILEIIMFGSVMLIGFVIIDRILYNYERN